MCGSQSCGMEPHIVTHFSPSRGGCGVQEPVVVRARASTTAVLAERPLKKPNMFGGSQENRWRRPRGAMMSDGLQV